MTDVLSFAEGRSLAEFRNDRLLRYAIERALEIIGEATAQLSDEIKARDKGLPWREMRGLRNIVAHAYHRVDAARVWRVVTQGVPWVHRRIRTLRNEVQREEG